MGIKECKRKDSVDLYCKFLAELPAKRKVRCDKKRVSVPYMRSVYVGNSEERIPPPFSAPLISNWYLKFMSSPNAKVLSLGESVAGQPLYLFTLGNLANPVLIAGGMHGNESAGPGVVWLLMNYFMDNPKTIPSEGIAFLLMQNPDGAIAGTRKNACNVDLSRNLPATDWKHTKISGPRPISEPETAALISAIQYTDPRWIISLHSRSYRNRKPVNNYDGPAKPIAKIMSKFNGYPIAGGLGYFTPGSLGSYAGEDKEVPVVTLEFPAEQSAKTCWAEVKDSLLEVTSHWWTRSSLLFTTHR